MASFNENIHFSSGRNTWTNDSTFPDATITLNLVEGADATASFQKALLVLNNIAFNVWTAVTTSGNFQRYGNIELCCSGSQRQRILSEIYVNPNSGCLILRNVSDIPAALVYEWLDIIVSKGVQSFFVVDGLQMSRFHSSGTAKKLRVLLTDNVTGLTRQLFSSIDLLEVGNVIDGCAAATLCHCTANGLPGIACVTIRGASYCRDAAKALEMLCPQICNFLDIDSLIFSESNIHKDMVRADTFLSRTENMFV